MSTDATSPAPTFERLLEPRPLAPQFVLLPMASVHHGSACVGALGDAFEQLGIERALLISGTTLATKTDLVERVEQAAGGRIAGVFSETVQHVHRGSVLRAVKVARELGIDGIVSFGGGTPNDTAKALAMALAEGIEDAAGFESMRVRFTYPDQIEIPEIGSETLPILAIPTTLSAGEFTHIAGITDEERKVKDLYIDPKMTARMVFLDAELTLATPLWLWLSSGMRAVDHAVEALASSGAHPFTDGLAVRALAMLDASLRATKADPEDLEARTRSQLGAWLSISGLANVTLGLSHGIGHQLGARKDVPHGHTSCVMMHSTMVFNKDHVGSRQAAVAAAMGVDLTGMNEEAANEAGREAVLSLVKDLGLPYRLREVGVEPEDFEAIAADALEDLIVAANPRQVSGTDEIVELLHSAY